MTLVSADFVVFGGGPAGAAAAVGLARQNASVILFERCGPKHFKPGEIVEASVQRPLRELGIWDDFLKLQPLRSAGTVSVWGSSGPSETSSMRNPWGAGFLLDRAAFEAFLLDAAAASGVRIVRGPETFELGPPINGRRSVRWSEGNATFQSHPAMFIEATGRAGGVASPNRRQRHDDLVAMLCYTHHGGPAERDMRLHIEAAEDGWWYAATLPAGVSVTAFLTDAGHIPRSAGNRQRFFAEQLQATTLIRRCFGTIGADYLRVAPANSSIRLHLKGNDWVAVGDAAAAYDPLAGLGVVAALSKGSAIARLLSREPSIASAADRYAQIEQVGFRNYLAGRRAIYGGQDRWKDRPFWKNRTSRDLTSA